MFRSEVNHENEYIYYNANLVNPLSNRSTVPCSFEQNFNKELIDDVSQYNLAITRFCVSTQNIPFWVCPIVQNQPNVNLTPYYIRLHYTDAMSREANSGNINLLYVNTIDPPVTQNNGASYYFSYNKQDFINMINVAISTAMDALRANYIASYPSGVTYPPPVGAQFINGLPNPDLPVFSYNESLQKFQIYFSANTWLSSSPTGIHFFINDLLYPFLQMPSMNTIQNTPDYRIEVVINDNYYTPSYYSTPSYSGLLTVPFVVVHSGHNTLGLFTPLNKIVFTSQSLQIASESVQPATALFNSASPSEINQVVNQQIITDFQPDMTTQNLVNRDFIQFNQSLINSRLIPFSTNKAQLKRLDVIVYWSDKNNNLYPLLLYPDCAFDLKLCFVKKSARN
jgi:hypothetical protein